MSLIQMEKDRMDSILGKFEEMNSLPEGFTMGDTLKVIQILNAYTGSLVVPDTGDDDGSRG